MAAVKDDLDEGGKATLPCCCHWHRARHVQGTEHWREEKNTELLNTVTTSIHDNILYITTHRHTSDYSFWLVNMFMTGPETLQYGTHMAETSSPCLGSWYFYFFFFARFWNETVQINTDKQNCASFWAELVAHFHHSPTSSLRTSFEPVATSQQCIFSLLCSLRDITLDCLG